MSRPNVVFLICDQMRGDCMSCDGHPDVKTPYIDSLAAHGVLFENAYSTCPSCIPARASLLTGKTPSHTGRVGYRDCVDWEFDHMMAEEFSAAGYQTACIGKMHVHPPRMSCGFQTLRLHDGLIGHAYRRADVPHWQHQDVSDDYLYWLRDHLGQSADVNAAGVDNNSWIARPWPYEERYHPTNWVAEESIRFLETRDRTRPFFLMASFVRPHQPFDAPQCYFDMYRGVELREPAIGDWDDVEATERFGSLYNSMHGCSDASQRREAMVGYYASITHMDHQIGRILTAVENDFLTRDTIFVFTSDHGEMLFDHHLFRKGLPYEGAARIPLIVQVGANIKKGERRAEVVGSTSDSVVALMDIMPTLLDLCDIAVPEGVDGLSLAQEVLEGSEIHRTCVHEEHATSADFAHHAIISKHDKYIWFSKTGREQYFNLDVDPREEHDAIDDEEHRGRIDALRRVLADRLKDREEGFVENGCLVPGKTPKRLLDRPVREA